MSVDLKTCQFCKKEIDKEAIKCPHCQEWLNKKEVSLKNPLIRTSLWMIFIVSIFIVLPKLYFAKQIQNIYKAPASFKADSKLFILNHRLSENKKSFSILGEIENKENFKWESVTIVAAFKDEKGVISSLGTGYVQNINPGSRKPFEVSFGCSEETYDPKRHSSYTIEIEDARGEFRSTENR